MFKRLVIAIILLGLVVGGIVWFNSFRSKMIADFMAARVPPPVPVTTTSVSPITWTPGLDAIGTAISTQGVDLATEAGGVVREILFTASDRVSKGQVLLQIDDDSEKANLAAANAALNLALAEEKRARTLSERGVGAQNTLESAAAQVESARAQVAQVQNSIDSKTMTAPFDGVVGIPRVEAGGYVTPGTVYATLQNLSSMRVNFSVPEQQMSMLEMGREISVQTEVGNFTGTGRIMGIEPQVDAASRLVSVRAEVANPSGILLPGQFLRVRVILPEEKGVIAVPQTAVASTLYGDSVYVIEKAEGSEQLKAIQTFIKLGRRFEGRIEVTEGLKDGQQIVTSGQNRLSNGSVVVVDNSVSLDTAGVADTAKPAETAK